MDQQTCHLYCQSTDFIARNIKELLIAVENRDINTALSLTNQFILILTRLKDQLVRDIPIILP